MTPAIKLLTKQRAEFTVHEYHHDSNAESYGLEAAEKLSLNPKQVFKTLVVNTHDDQLAVAIVPVAQQLSLKACAKALGVKKVAMADKQRVQRTTGYFLGGVSPIGQKKRLPTVIDASAQGQVTIFVSAGRRGLEIELAPSLLQASTNATFADIAEQ
ncbi:Cys-tRNA(Pro) deacylase [Halioxenophilus aromaticivorans]|uniref:Cys-tRNA(Pro)/Cys-tRNA(Cys) deacylase n=1 Tax=Halioxenophilus aromaticivorans TaxID=1306992 RepID=A0AAV3U1X1_9ALTE